MSELTTEARRQIVAGLVRRDPGVSLAAVRRAVAAAGHDVGDKALRRDMMEVRGDLQRETMQRRQETVAMLLARKLTVREIQRALAGAGFDVCERTVARDIVDVRTLWRERAAATIDELRAGELAELREMERLCAQEIPKATSDKDRVRWIAEWRAIKARIAAMMGLDAPTQLKHSGEIDLGGGLTAEERREIAAAIAASAEPGKGAPPATGAAARIEKAPKTRARRAARKADA